MTDAEYEREQFELLKRYLAEWSVRGPSYPQGTNCHRIYREMRMKRKPKPAIEQAAEIKASAIANAKAALEHHFKPAIGQKLDEAKLQRENEELRKTLDRVTKEMQETNMLNAKLLYVTKLFRGSLTIKEKVMIVDLFDLATTMREVKLVYVVMGRFLGSTDNPFDAEPIKTAVKRKRQKK